MARDIYMARREIRGDYHCYYYTIPFNKDGINYFYDVFIRLRDHISIYEWPKNKLYDLNVTISLLDDKMALIKGVSEFSKELVFPIEWYVKMDGMIEFKVDNLFINRINREKRRRFLFFKKKDKPIDLKRIEEFILILLEQVYEPKIQGLLMLWLEDLGLERDFIEDVFCRFKLNSNKQLLV